MAERLVDKIFTGLALRKAYHFVGGFLLLLVFSTASVSGIYMACLVYLLGFLIFAKRVSFAIAGVLLVFAITRSRFAALGALVVFTLGDGLAAVAGSRFRERHLPWNRGKTTVGSAVFLASSVAGLSILVSSVSPVAGWTKWLAILVPSVAACIVESLPISVIRDRKPDDNLAVILATGLILFWFETALAIPKTALPWLFRP